MAEILKEWLTNVLHEAIMWDAQNFSDMMKNGHIVARVLHSYNVIDKQKLGLIRSGNEYNEIKYNWKFLTQWLDKVDVCLTAEEVENLELGKGSALLRLFYQLFLNLDKRDRTDFLKQEKKMVTKLLDKMESSFKVENLHEDQESQINDISKPLLDQKHLIEWEKKKAAKVKASYDYIRHRLSETSKKIKSVPILCYQQVPPKMKKLTSKEKRDIEIFHRKYPCKYESYTYEELINMEDISIEKKDSLFDTDWAESYLKELQNRINQRTDSEEFQTQIQKKSSDSLWEKSIGEEESEVNLDVAKKVMKLSQFERQICTRVMDNKQQARNLKKHRVDSNRQFEEQRKQEFGQFLDSIRENIASEARQTPEKQKLELLHKRMYAEKMKKRRQHYYEICYETMLSIVDYATKYAYFSQLFDYQIPDRFIKEWKTLYFRKQPIFEVFVSTVEISTEPSSSKALKEEHAPEEIIRLELDRQELLNDSDFIEYHTHSYSWTLDLLIPNYDPESEERKHEHLGTQILGHVVYRCLQVKYPYPPPRSPADLPDFNVKAIIRNLPDKSFTMPMQILLNKSKIHVVRLEHAINFCLREYKHDMIGCTDIELNFDQFCNACHNDERKEMIKSLKIEDDVYIKNREDQSPVSGPLPPNCKQTQTPKTLPEENIVLSTAAELGKYTYEAFSIGEPLTDHLLAAMLVEYIKDQPNIQGFVIINYPNTYHEARIVETTFSGKEPPREDDLDDRDETSLEESIVKHCKPEKDPFKEIRISRLVTDPHKRQIDIPFESYFTCYLKLKETEDISQEYVIWDLNHDNSDFTDRFYAALGMNYSLYYENIDKLFLVQMCKYIIGDFTMPLKSCDNLFGERIVSQLDFSSYDEKRNKLKLIKSDSTMLKSKEKIKGHTSKILKSHAQVLEVVKAPDTNSDVHQDEKSDSLEEVPVEEESPSLTTTEDVKILPGEEDWEYGELPLPDHIGSTLATCWLEIEKAYVYDMETLLHSKRLQMNCLIPYCIFMKDMIEKTIALPSSKQDLVNAFQKEFSNFQNYSRDEKITKKYWHCRIKDLQNKLYDICDKRKIFAEQQKKYLILANWPADELVIMCKTYISCIQAELNRSILTFQTLHDFYIAMIKKLLPTERLSFKELSKISRAADNISESESIVDVQLLQELRTAYTHMYFRNIQIDSSNDPLNMIVENNVTNAIEIIKKVKDDYCTLIGKESDQIAAMAQSVKKKDDSESIKTIELMNKFIFNSLKCIDEWSMAVNGEMYRVHLRFLSLQYKCFRDLKVFNYNIYKSYNEIQTCIDTYYMNEIKSVDRLCKYLQTIVENNKRIPDSIVLYYDQFIIDPNELQFTPSQSLTVLDTTSKISNSFEFKIGELAHIRSQLKIINPNGIALRTTFTYLLQDYILSIKESNNITRFPDIWRKVDPEQVPKLVHSLFGDSVYVDWREFLIYCLNIRFPSIDELLYIRKSFRCCDLESTELISRDDFLNVKFWFENDSPNAMLRMTLVKHFLFELYETAPNLINYSAMLLAFCKNADPILGFVAALSIAVGKKICHSRKECEEVVCKLIRRKVYRDECRACAQICAGKFLELLLANVVSYCESTTITEIQYTEVKDDKKKKKGKKVGKKLSTMNGKLKSKDKIHSHSRLYLETDLKHPLASKTGEELQSPEEKPEEKEQVEEEYESSIVELPNVAYAVSQDVIQKVLRICLPWYFPSSSEENVATYQKEVQEVIQRLAVHHENGDIYIYLFVDDPKICKFIHKVKKFTKMYLTEQVYRVCL